MRKKADMRAGRSLAVPFRTYIVFLENRPDVKLAVISPPETLLNQIDRLFASTINVSLDHSTIGARRTAPDKVIQNVLERT